jgi:hypothetical protein
MISVIAPRGEMASFPVGTTPFLLNIDSAWGISVPEIPRTPDDAADQEAGWYLPIRLIREADWTKEMASNSTSSRGASESTNRQQAKHHHHDDLTHLSRQILNLP